MLNWTLIGSTWETVVSRVNQEQQLPLPHESAFLIHLLADVACDLSLDLRVHEAVERANPLAIEGHVPLHHFDDPHPWNAHHRSRCSLVASGNHQHRAEEDQRAMLHADS